MATATATHTVLNRPRVLAPSTASSARSQPAGLTHAPAGHDANGDVAGIVGGSGILLVQACALMPGLLPILLLTGAFALPLVLPVLALGIVVGIPVGLWRLARRLVTR